MVSRRFPLIHPATSKLGDDGYSVLQGRAASRAQFTACQPAIPHDVVVKFITVASSRKEGSDTSEGVIMTKGCAHGESVQGLP